jgi:hypothetical protein
MSTPPDRNEDMDRTYQTDEVQTLNISRQLLCRPSQPLASPDGKSAIEVDAHVTQRVTAAQLISYK